MTARSSSGSRRGRRTAGWPGSTPTSSGSASGSRADEYGKDDVRDFALWKGPKPGEPSWDTAIGTGRPGWHIECSAMSMKHLGPSFDIHTGGIDLIFPHHEDEIAQSEAATGQPFVRTWLHCAHLQMSGAKMAKSTGNIARVADLLDAGVSARALRYALIAVHYRAAINYSDESLTAAGAALDRLDAALAALDAYREDAPGRSVARRRPRRGADAAFGAALDDDLNVSAALAARVRPVRDAQPPDRRAVAVDGRRGRGARRDPRPSTRSSASCRTGRRARRGDAPRCSTTRAAARATRDWAASDRLRDELAGARHRGRGHARRPALASAAGGVPWLTGRETATRPGEPAAVQASGARRAAAGRGPWRRTAVPAAPGGPGGAVGRRPYADGPAARAWRSRTGGAPIGPAAVPARRPSRAGDRRGSRRPSDRRPGSVTTGSGSRPRGPGGRPSLRPRPGPTPDHRPPGPADRRRLSPARRPAAPRLRRPAVATLRPPGLAGPRPRCRSGLGRRVRAARRRRPPRGSDPDARAAPRPRPGAPAPTIELAGRARRRAPTGPAPARPRAARRGARSRPAAPPTPTSLDDDEELVAGRRPVEEAFVARRPARRLLVVPQRRQALEQLVLHATSLRIPVVEVEGGTLTAVAGFDGHQGIALVVEPRPLRRPRRVLARAVERGEPPFVLVLDSLEDPQNVGTLLRSAEAAGVHGVLFPTRRQAPLTPGRDQGFGRRRRAPPPLPGRRPAGRAFRPPIRGLRVAAPTETRRSPPGGRPARADRHRRRERGPGTRRRRCGAAATSSSGSRCAARSGR